MDNRYHHSGLTRHMLATTLFVLGLSVSPALATRNRFNLDVGWRFQSDAETPPACNDPTATFPLALDNEQCLGLSETNAISLETCIDQCCAQPSWVCSVYQWCPANSTECSPPGSCWTGQKPDSCRTGAAGWVSRGRTPVPPPAPGNCSDPRCQPSTDDSTWRLLNLPHDAVVEGNFSKSAVESSGYLPFTKQWYRRHLSIPAAFATSTTLWLDVDGAQTQSTVWLNGRLLGNHLSGYTASRYFIDPSLLNFAADNVLVIFVDSTTPDGWWYDGGGLYRSVWLTAVTTPGPFIAPWGLYAPSNVSGPITMLPGGAPVGNAVLTPSVEVWTNATSGVQAFSVTLAVRDKTGAVVASSSGSGTVAAGVPTIWAPPAALTWPNASLWHLGSPSLYSLQANLSVGGAPVDSVTATFGVRRARFDAEAGFVLNDVPTKIMGAANHQDFAGVGVAVPDHLQWYRVSKLQQMGVNGWRTAHNPPTTSLLDAADELGMLVWDESHRNGQDAEVPALVKRDRNHPSVIIWSICNEVLCNTAGEDWVQAAHRMKGLMQSLDPRGNRVVSANQNGWIGPSTPLDLQGFDYATQNYDQWHSQAPQIPSISSETSSAVSDRGEYANDAVGGHVSGYDTNEPSWGETAEGAWGGIGISASQGILTRPFISGGWTWTGWDYRGEPTPYAFPDTNSHFGIVDLASFEKDRFYWYQAWFTAPSPPVLHLFPHWNWNVGDNVDVWVYSNADSIELLVNGVSQGRKSMPQFAHVNWNGVPFVPGSIEARAYINGSTTPAAVAWRNTTGPAVALRISIRDGVGSTLYAGCGDASLVMVEVVDAAGAQVPSASHNITFTVTGPATLAGTGNGDPATLVNNKSPVRPAFHALALAVIQGGSDIGTVTVTASASGLGAPVTLNIPQVAPDASVGSWCHGNEQTI